MLKELKQLVDRDETLEAEDLRRAAATLLRKQFLYADVESDRKMYSLLMAQQEYYSQLFDALGHDLLLDRELGMVGSLPRNRSSSVRLKQEEALLLLTVRLVYEDALEGFKLQQGCAYTDSEKILAKFEVATGKARPNLTDLRRIFQMFARFGVIEVLTDTERVVEVRIRPAIRLVLNEGWLKTLEAHTGSGTEKSFSIAPEDDSASYDDEEVL